MRVLLALLIASLGCTAHAQAPPLFVELVAPKRMLFVGETASCVIRIGFEQEYVREHLLPIVQRKTSLPFLLKTAFATPMSGVQWLPRAQQAAGPTLAMDDDVITTTPVPVIVRDGKRLAVVEIEQRFRTTAVGRAALPGARLIYAATSGFNTDFLGTRMPRDRTEGELFASAIEVEVLPPPSLGRPPEFSGAIGRFTLAARADREAARVGDSVQLSIEIGGPGITDEFVPPTLATDPAFHLLGTRKERTSEQLILHHELRVLETSATSLPACVLVSFDPDGDPPGYRRFTAPRIAIKLLAANAAARVDAPTRHSGAPTANAVLPLPTGDMAPSDAPLPPAPWMMLALLVAPWSVAAGVGVKRLVISRRIRDGGRRAARKAATTASHALARGAEPGAIFITFLASRLRLEPALVLGPDLREQMHHAAVPAELGVRVQRMVEATLAARFGAATPLEQQVVLAMIAEMEAALPPVDAAP